MRLAESRPLRGMVLVSAYTSDLGDSLERSSGYFSRPWQWQSQRENAGFIVQFASTDDPFLPMSEQRAVREGLGLKPGSGYMERKGRGHFQKSPFPELIEILISKLNLTA